MRIPFHCPHCEAVGETDDSFFGKTVKCPQCGEPFRVERLDSNDPDPEESPLDAARIEAEQRAMNLRLEAEAESRREAAILARQAELARNEVEVLTSIEKQLSKQTEYLNSQTENLAKQTEHLASLRSNVGCMYAYFIFSLVVAGLLVLFAMN